MKAISLWQPWASLVAAGVKPFETRHWAPPASLVGQRIAIHAAKKTDKQASALCEDLLYGQHPAGGFDLARRLQESWGETDDENFDADLDDSLFQNFGHAPMPAGCIVCTAKLHAWWKLPVENVKPDPWGDYTPGRYAWLLTDVQPLRPPVLMTGRQGWWELPQGWMAKEAA